MLLFAGAMVWHYLPSSTKKGVGDFAGAMETLDGKKAKDAASALLPKNPQEQRATLIEELKQNVLGLKESIRNSKIKGAPAAEERLEDTERITRALEEANKKEALTDRALSKLIDALIPNKHACSTPAS